MNTHDLICDFGRHKGERYTRLPVSYLKWMVNVKSRGAAIANAELERRGTPTPELDVSGHALDRASVECLDIYRKTRNDDEGIYSWLCRVSVSALKMPMDSNGNFRYYGMVFAFERDVCWPVLKTVMREKSHDDQV